MSTLRILRQHARAWWYFKQLRQCGNCKEAATKERESVRSTIKSLRECKANGGYLSIGRGGWTLHISDGHRLEHYGGLEQATCTAALRYGIPIIDSTSIPDDRIYDVIKFPMIGIERVDSTRGSLSFAPMLEVARMYHAKGATIHNMQL